MMRPLVELLLIRFVNLFLPRLVLWVRIASEISLDTLGAARASTRVVRVRIRRAVERKQPSEFFFGQDGLFQFTRAVDDVLQTLLGQLTLENLFFNRARG